MSKPCVKKWRHCLVLSVVFVLCHSISCAFNVPERLEFELGWMGLKAGSASLEIKRQDKGLKIISTAKSARWVSVFYPVRDRVESLLGTLVEGIGDTGKKESIDLGIGLPLNYHIKTREGRYRKDMEFVFDQDAGKVMHIDHLKKERLEFDVPDRIYDPLSAFYQVRTMELTVGNSVYVPVFDSKKVWNLEVKVLRKERLKTPVGTFDTIVIKPLMKSEGIFKKKGDIYIWLTDDEKRIPVLVKSKIAVGSIDAVLVGGEY